MSTYTTIGGKGVSSYVDPKMANHVRIKFDTGGELPEELEGLFTSMRVADAAIVKYVETSKAKKEPKKEV